jgi:hypothetical protein
MHPFREGCIESCALYAAYAFIFFAFVIVLTIAFQSVQP